MMKAAVIDRYGPPEVLHYTDVAQPPIKPDQLLVKVHASSINPIDWKIRKGMLKILTGTKFPLILGFDLAGEVVAVGDRVTRFQVGDQVYARLDQMVGGAYAEYVAVAEKVAAHKPTTISYLEAAAVPLAAMTALQGLRDEGQLKAGQRVLINGASGGVGTYAVQLAKILGAGDVVGVCSAQNLDLVRQLGGDRAIDYHQHDFIQDNVRYDLIFDVVGNRSFNECKRVLQPQGIYVTTQPYPGNYARSLASRLIPGPKYNVVMQQSKAEDLTFLKVQIESGNLRSVVDRTFPLTDIAAAHAYAEQGHSVGKVAIAISD